MTEHHSNTDARPELTGAHARFERVCASHPWRVIGIWFLATLVLIGLTAAFHGKLVNEFKLPGSDTQRATDLLKAKFPAQNGSALTFVFQAPKGQRIDTPAHKAAIEKIIAIAKNTPYATRTTSPFEKGNLSKTRPRRVLRPELLEEQLRPVMDEDQGPDGRHPGGGRRRPGSTSSSPAMPRAAHPHRARVRSSV